MSTPAQDIIRDTIMRVIDSEIAVAQVVVIARAQERQATKTTIATAAEVSRCRTYADRLARVLAQALDGDSITSGTGHRAADAAQRLVDALRQLHEVR